MNVRERTIAAYDKAMQQANTKEEHQQLFDDKQAYLSTVSNEVAELCEQARSLREAVPSIEKLSPSLYRIDGDYYRASSPENESVISFSSNQDLDQWDGVSSVTNLPPEELSREIKEKRDLLDNQPTPKEVLSDGVRGEKLAERFSGLKGPKQDDYLKAPKSRVESFQKIRGNPEAGESLLQENVPEGAQVKTFDSVSGILKQGAQLYDQRNPAYGSAYKRQGEVMTALFPDGITLNSVDDFNRFTILSTVISKIIRYTNRFDQPHTDSVLDNITYLAMLLEIDKTLKLDER